MLKEPQILAKHQLLVLPGGFSFGDEIVSGKVLAIKLKDHLQELLHKFIDQGSLLLASCNGFQVIVQMGLLPNVQASTGKQASLVQNYPPRFVNRWIGLEVNQASSCQFLSGLKMIELPIRHGEGRLAVDASHAEPIKKQGCLRYEHDINGSFDRIAALTNSKGNVLGLMPHPEAFVRWTQHPAWTKQRGSSLVENTSQQELKTERMNNSKIPDGLAIFKNAAKAIKQG